MNVLDKLGFGPKRVVIPSTMPDGREAYWVEVTPPKTFVRGAKTERVFLNGDQYRRYQQWLAGGVLIQEVLPDLSPSQREILQSGLGPETWDAMFPEEDEGERPDE